MLFLAKKDDDQFYVNPEDAKKYADDGYEIIDPDTGNSLTSNEISKLEAVVEGSN